MATRRALARVALLPRAAEAVRAGVEEVELGVGREVRAGEPVVVAILPALVVLALVVDALAHRGEAGCLARARVRIAERAARQAALHRVRADDAVERAELADLAGLERAGDERDALDVADVLAVEQARHLVGGALDGHEHVHGARRRPVGELLEAVAEGDVGGVRRRLDVIAVGCCGDARQHAEREQRARDRGRTPALPQRQGLHNFSPVRGGRRQPHLPGARIAAADGSADHPGRLGTIRPAS